ncbi:MULTISPECIES: hypothetical protein [Streptomyces]|uniref:Uncharacterized protein n=1 Tax=Streptomyces stelliscabiei TaxID=146820 RepID=A0A8I0TNK3_9ACTN|nr:MULTISPECIES: hypothetical protein [Streptomyces]MBE1594337.1 hypothetical protein [Streptomyces stelliscabiei]MDX2522080.1 hypothetical protein [Streptomyces stelliscabiei]MDX2556063.1 hypothetical protein [Streptomyces stelliscabiei]MDX2617755.1 hypothetical protein [Streptomyces stelliscabiei]MDX2640136.1 hypothetical protein [Streptomyces stelliscabiei]
MDHTHATAGDDPTGQTAVEVEGAVEAPSLYIHPVRARRVCP